MRWVMFDWNKRADAAIAKITKSKGKSKKQDNVSGAVKKLTKAEFDALPKLLQKELKEYR